MEKFTKKIIPIIAVFLLFINGGLASQNQPQNVYVGLYLINLGRFDIATGSFTADFYLALECETACPQMDFEFMNGRATSFEKTVDKPDLKSYRIQASLVSPIDLKKFPFDQQRLQIIIEDKNRNREELIYVPKLNESGIDPSIIFIGWDMGNWSAYEREHYYETYGESYSQYVFEVPISRITINAIFKTFLPITFIVLIMLSSFVLDPDKITTRLTMVGSALVASVMFHVSIANQIPPVGYLTFIDKFMVLTYFITLLSFVFNVFLMELYEEKKEKVVQKLHRSTEFTMFIVVPILYFLLFVLFL